MEKPTSIRRWTGTLISLSLMACAQPMVVTPDASVPALREAARRAGPPLWASPLTGEVVEDMRFFGEYLLVTQRAVETDPTSQITAALDAETGSEIWRWSYDGSGQYRLVLALQDLLLFRTGDEASAGVVALHPDDGRELWRVSQRAPSLALHPAPGSGTALAVERSEGGATLTGYALTDGRRRWRRSLEAADTATTAPPPLVELDRLWHFHDGVEHLSAKDGRTLWRNPEVSVPGASPPPRVDSGRLFLVDAEGRLLGLDAGSGEVELAVPLPGDISYSNIYPLGERVYLRGVGETEGSPLRHVVAAVDPDQRDVLWTYRGSSPSVSNFIEHEGRLFFATPSAVVSLDRESGARYYAASLTNSGRTFPVRIRRFGNRIIFVGELLIGGVDAMTGQKLYQHGFNPVSLGASLTALDGNIARLERQLGATSSERRGMSTTEMHLAEARRYQNLSNRYFDTANERWNVARETGSTTAYYEARTAQMQGQMAQDWARTQSTLALYSTTWDVAADMSRAIWLATRTSELYRQRLWRRSIIAAYGKAEGGEYAYRPGKLGDDLVGVSVVHLPSGRIRETRLSPAYLSYGIWNLIDPEKRVVYHHGIGLDTNRHSLRESPSGERHLYQSFLIAREIEIPERGR